MRAVEFLSERMNTGWVRGWVQRSVPGQMPNSQHLDWYSDFFKNLSADKEFKAWVKANVVGKLSIRPKLVDDQEELMSILDAEHVTYEGKNVTHEIVTTINVAPTIENEKQMMNFVNRLSARFTHELNHAQQVSLQLKKSKDQTATLDRSHSILKPNAPAPKTEREKYYQYLLDRLETDAWISEIAQDLIHDLGDQALPSLPNILKQAQREPYVVIKSKIVQVPALNALIAAINHYRGYLKYSKEQLYNKLQKELYGYLSRHSNK